jgi:hypothetical protein
MTRYLIGTNHCLLGKKDRGIARLHPLGLRLPLGLHLGLIALSPHARVAYISKGKSTSRGAITFLCTEDVSVEQPHHRKESDQWEGINRNPIILLPASTAKVSATFSRDAKFQRRVTPPSTIRSHCTAARTLRDCQPRDPLLARLEAAILANTRSSNFCTF